MTMLEKIKKANPKADPEAIVKYMCPEDFGLEKGNKECPAMTEPFGLEQCAKCWAREYAEEGGEGAV